MARSIARGTKTYLQQFDEENPFEGVLGRGRFATHTWAVVALLGAYVEKVGGSRERLRRRGITLQIAPDEGPDGADMSWEGAGRRWLIRGE
ncbi:hypothetical protein CAC42_7704 [Sphaceloma murrayae]|uniref:Uncharacterized protein n=1 Tax=Sphaceloma murrayae TaxID=2082308 RepID=A0A2K1QXG6_9PEZI|nr:hypothetical protein CAC42_7704 [Sphaceloma murrayae]